MHEQSRLVILVSMIAALLSHSWAEAASPVLNFLSQQSSAGCEMLGNMKRTKPRICEKYLTQKHGKCLGDLLLVLDRARQFSGLRAETQKRLTWIERDVSALIKSGLTDKVELTTIVKTLADRYLQPEKNKLRFVEMAEPMQSDAELRQIIAIAESSQPHSDGIKNQINNFVTPHNGHFGNLKSSLQILVDWMRRYPDGTPIPPESPTERVLLSNTRIVLQKVISAAEQIIQTLREERELGGNPTRKFTNQLILFRGALTDVEIMINEINSIALRIPMIGRATPEAQLRQQIEAGHKLNSHRSKPPSEFERYHQRIGDILAELNNL